MKKRFKIDTKELQQLEDMGFRVNQLSPYHFRISYADNTELMVDVWPTSHKYCLIRNGTQGSGEVYDSLIFLIESTLDIYHK